MEQKIPLRNVQSFGYSSRGCPCLRNLWKTRFHSAVENSEVQAGLSGRTESVLYILLSFSHVFFMLQHLH